MGIELQFAAAKKACDNQNLQVQNKFLGIWFGSKNFGKQKKKVLKLICKHISPLHPKDVQVSSVCRNLKFVWLISIWVFALLL